METGSQIDSYTGNAALGSGSNVAIPVTSTAGLNLINDTGKNIMLLNHENNVNLWKQKMADRDTTLKLLQEGQISSGNILEQDRLVYDKAQKDVNDAYYTMIKKGGLNNPEAYSDYITKMDALSDTVTHAQSRYLEMTKLKDEKAAQTLPSKQKFYDDHIEAQSKKGFWSYIDPAQQSLTFDWERVRNPILSNSLVGGASTPTATTEKTSSATKGGKTSTTQTETTSPVKGKQSQPVGNIIYKDGLPYSRTIQYYSFQKMLQNSNQGYLDKDGETAAQQNLNKQYVESAPPYISKPYLQNIIDRAEQYNSDRQLKKGDKDWIDVDRVRNSIIRDPQTGQFKVGLSTPEFNALASLASVDGSYAPTTDTFLKDEAAQSGKDRHDRAMEGIGWEKTKAYADLMKFKLKKAKSEEAQNQVLDDMYVRNLKEQGALVNNIPGLGYATSTVQADGSLPLYTIEGNKPTQLRPIGSTPVWADPDPKNNAQPNPKNPKQKPVAWKGGYYEPEYFYKDKPIDAKSINDAYERGVKNGYKGTINDYLKDALSDKESGISVKMRGENGSTDMQLSTAAQRIINNLDTKRGQTGVFSGDDNPPTEESESSSSSSESSNNSSDN